MRRGAVTSSQPERHVCGSIIARLTAAASVSLHLFYTNKLNGNHLIIRQLLRKGTVEMSVVRETPQRFLDA